MIPQQLLLINDTTTIIANFQRIIWGKIQNIHKKTHQKKSHPHHTHFTFQENCLLKHISAMK